MSGAGDIVLDVQKLEVNIPTPGGMLHACAACR